MKIKPQGFYDYIASVYDNAFKGKSFIKENKEIRDRIIKYIKPGLKVLDMGCGTGLLLELVNIKKDDYCGIDISKGMINKAQSKFPLHKFIFSNIEDCNGIKENSIDVAISLFGSFSYVDNFYTAIDNMYNILKENGKYFIMFYEGNYYPYTHKVFGKEIIFNHYDVNKIRNAFEDNSKVETYNNFIIIEGRR